MAAELIAKTLATVGGGDATEGEATRPDLPFLNRLRSEVSDSPEFRALAARLYSGVRESLRKDDQASFGTLTRGEQEVLVNRVRSQLLTTRASIAAHRVASVLMEKPLLTVQL